VGDLPRTFTGGLVDPMKTKLEMMVAYLAGRKGDGAELIRRELEDPTSDASLCLEAVRLRSRSICATELPVMRRPIPSRSIPKRVTTGGIARRRLPPQLLVVSSAALVFIAVALAWRAQNDQFRQLKASLARREARWGEQFARLEAALTRRETPLHRQHASSNVPTLPEPKPTTPADGATILALARIEARLGELGQRLGEKQPRQDQDDQQVDQLRRELDSFRQEVKSAVRASKQESQDLGLAVRAILQLLRRLTMESRATDSMQIPVPLHGHEPGHGQGPGMIPGQPQVPGQVQMPGQDPSFRAPGRAKR
jgi:hypothetical protein